MPSHEDAVRLYGCDLYSDWPLNGFSPGGPPLGIVELREAIREVFLEAGAPVDHPTDDWFLHRRLTDGGDYLRWTGLFEFLVSPDGLRIGGRALEHANEESFHTYLLGQVLSFALLRQGIEPLHATAVVVDAAAAAFLGETGGGKSTLAAAFLSTGYPLLSDDLLVTRRRDGGFEAFPGPMRIKLYPEVAERVLGVPAVGIPMNPDVTKQVILLEGGRRLSGGGPVPLRALYVLDRPAGTAPRRVEIRTLSPREAFVELTRYTFNDILIGPERLTRQFGTATALAGSVPVRSLRYPYELDRIDAVRDAILADLSA